jgi:hypothetical protein
MKRNVLVTLRKNPQLAGMSIAGVFVTALLAVTMALPTYANNIQVGEPTLGGQNTTDNYTYVQFDLSWDNSWRTSSAPNNWDAAWVFVKYQKTDANEWKHATLNIDGHSVTNDNGVAAEIATPSDGKGVFLYRADDDTGSINWGGVKLRWNYGTDGLVDSDTVTVKVFAIEMVYTPAGNFNLGDIKTYSGSVFNFYDSGTSEHYEITGEGEITISPNPTLGNLWAEDNIEQSELPAAFPKGYNAIYCMKYEISQGQYADFLSLLTDAQDDSRYPGQNGNSRHTISGSYGDYSASRPDRACNYLSWADGAAYADWAGLRPMTELEFEKICRGAQQSVVALEFAWGDTNITQALTITGSEDGTETVDGNCNYISTGFTDGDGGQGPLRCGIFATSSTTTRQPAGASYYGVMEMSGNVREYAVTVANSAGRGFTRDAHGDGSLDINGNADVLNWPGTDASGAYFRGGGWKDNAGSLRVMNRKYITGSPASRGDDTGFRGVRTAP